MQINTSITSNYSKNDKKSKKNAYPFSAKAPTRFTHCVVRVPSGKVYKSKILRETKRYIKLSWFDGPIITTANSMSFDGNYIVGFCNE